ncbi:MAG: hypothetical protein HY906_24690 [Deltaproteobacteria bacterium]|nr:hypothetical protein [Deltaproteobacteria bacterium]
MDEAAHLRPEFVGELATSVRALRGRFAHDHKEMANEIRATSEAFRGRPTARRTDT